MGPCWVVDLPSRSAPTIASHAPVATSNAPIDRGVLERLERELREAITARAHNNMSESRALRLAFAAFDADKSGVIEFPEFVSCARRIGMRANCV